MKRLFVVSVLLSSLVYSGTATAAVRAEILGSTNFQLNARFLDDHKCLGSSCFGPLATNTSEGRGPEFTAVGFYNGVAVSFDQKMPNHTTVAGGLARLRLNLPADTTFGPVIKQFSQSGDWGATTGTSKALGRLLLRFDPQGKFCVFFQAFHGNGNTTYSTTNVQEASISAWVIGVDQGCG